MSVHLSDSKLFQLSDQLYGQLISHVTSHIIILKIIMILKNVIIFKIFGPFLFDLHVKANASFKIMQKYNELNRFGACGAQKEYILKWYIILILKPHTKYNYPENK